jgi:hypothetical protein
MAQVRFELREWNADKLLARSTQILEEFAPIMADEARRQISLVQWDWKRGTLRFRSIGGLGTPSGNGVYVKPGPRDILDTGFLRDSQQAPVVSQNSLSITWTAPYAGVVLAGGDYGAYTNPNGTRVDGDRRRPGRNWIAEAFKAQDPSVFFVRRWRELGGA